jgi:hypothetical protein
VIVFWILAALIVFYVLSPFFERAFRKRRLVAEADVHQNLLFRKEEILSALSDLEYDYQMKKMSESDYLQLKEKLRQEAIEIMKKLDEPAPKQSKARKVAS